MNFITDVTKIITLFITYYISQNMNVFYARKEVEGITSLHAKEVKGISCLQGNWMILRRVKRHILPARRVEVPDQIL